MNEYWVIMKAAGIQPSYVYGPFTYQEARKEYDRRTDLYEQNNREFTIRLTKTEILA